MGLDKRGVKGDTTYIVHFRVHQKIEEGTTMAVLGNYDDLGDWKIPKYFLKWTEGDVWVSNKPLVVKRNFFNYKYAAIKEKTEIVMWERGVDRIADLDIMEESHYSSPDTMRIASQH